MGVYHDTCAKGCEKPELEITGWEMSVPESDPRSPLYYQRTAIFSLIPHKSRNCIFLCHSLLTGGLCSHYITRLLQMATSCRPVLCIPEPHRIQCPYFIQYVTTHSHAEITVQTTHKRGFNQEETQIKLFISDLNGAELLRHLNSLIQPETQITMNIAVYVFTQMTKLQHLQNELLRTHLLLTYSMVQSPS